MAFTRDIFENSYPGKQVIYNDIILPVFSKAEDQSFTDPLEIQDKDSSLINNAQIFAQTKGACPIAFADVELKENVDIKRCRVNIQHCIKSVIQKRSSAIVFFHYENNKDIWRITYIKPDKNKEIGNTSKRFSYICGKGIGCRTIAERFEELSIQPRITEERLIKAFSLEALTEDFYKELFDWYEWAVTESKFPVGNGDKVRLVSETETKGENIIRLITRLMFVWFIKQKKLVPDWIFDSKIIDEYLINFADNSLENGNYYNAILQNLFFATLNKDINERKWAKGSGQDRSEDYGVKTLYRDDIEKSFYKSGKSIELLEKLKEVPFLNGGLFECLDSLHTRTDGKNEQTYIDGFSRETKRRAFVPNALFFQKKDGTHEGIISILKRYNFTIEENSPNDVEVALDPELLGKVFENLLGVFNPETSDTARHETGSFYTPREIVNYMVDQTLKDYLRTNIEDINEDVLAFLFESDNNSELNKSIITEKLYNQIKEALKTIKVLDPACGSGAFPMGMLNRIVEIFKIISASKKIESKEIYNFKKEVIENCIYGVDIQPIAVQISKLRFFISLICEQEKDAEEDNFGYYPLPNLETKFVAANTLVQLNRGTPSLFVNSEVQDLKKELHLIREKHFSAKTAKEKHELRDKDKICREKLAELLKSDNVCSAEDAKQLAEWNPYNQNSHAEFFDPEWMYSMDVKPLPKGKYIEHQANNLGFDIVIGNPPYIEEGKNSSAFDGFRENKRYYMGKMNIWYGFAQLGLDLLKDNGTLCFIAKNNWTTSSGAKLLRNQIINDSKIIQLLDFNSYMIFKSASIQTMIMMFKKDYVSNNYQFDYRALGNEAQKADMLDLLEKRKTEKTRYLTPTIKRADFVDKFLVFSNSDYIFNKMKEGKVYLQDNEIAQGIVPNPDIVNTRNIKNLKDKSIEVGEGVFVVDKDKFLKIDKEEKKYIKPMYEPYQMDKYYLNSKNDKCILYITKNNWKNDAPTLKKHLSKYKAIMETRRENKEGRISFYHLHWPREEKFFKKGAKILSVRKCDKPTFVYYEPEAYVMMAVNIIITDRWNLKYLTGVLNSSLVAFWLKNKGKMQGSNYQVDKEPLMDIPLPKEPSKEEQEDIALIVDKIIDKKIANKEADTSKLEREINKKVYALYNITDQSEIDIIEGK